MTVVCLDTQIVQWGVLRRASDQSQQHLVDRSAALLKLIADTMIAATALARGATRVYTNDRRFRNSAGTYIEIALLDDLDLSDEQLGLNLPDSDPGQ